MYAQYTPDKIILILLYWIMLGIISMVIKNKQMFTNEKLRFWVG